ncbi:protein kinase [Aeromicrobium sp. 636]|uniref:Protein kinase family protein n=1 Tax=Aeromicrobium senzhongii TaxID=2663859 RepID=A0A8I0ETM5_9ACTN|nr:MULTISPECIES: protein kinase family protein [Aeromicrobium]MBC9225869.1 protein kinase family protein [Aeromicrobium senzhongii]MCQ3997976.1 protein kinase [Aeromicrobium sp. 636]
MAGTEAERRLRDLAERYKGKTATLRYEEMYRGVPQGNLLAYLHESLDKHLSTINKCAKTNRHFWAANSVELLDLLEAIEEDLDSLQRAGVPVVLTDSYQRQIDYLNDWVSHSGGSPIPDGFTPLDVSRYSPVFVTRNETTIAGRAVDEKFELQIVGEGSYALVFSYVDPKYGKRYAVKRARRTSSQRDIERFKREFTTLSQLRFPHVVEVYRYDDERNQYTMEYCDTNVRDFIKKHNGSLSFHVRRTLALQCLYGLNYLHQKDILHRDVSPQNVLLRLYDADAFSAKIADLGLLKDLAQDFTKTHTDLRGTRLDPTLESMADFRTEHEVFAVGWLLWFIFVGREGLAAKDGGPVADLVRLCIHSDTARRPKSMLELIEAVRSLPAPATPSVTRDFADSPTDGF